MSACATSIASPFATQASRFGRATGGVSARGSRSTRGTLGPGRILGLSGLEPELASNERRAVARDLLGAFEHAPPDLRCACELGQRVAERLDHDPAVIVDLSDRVERLAPGDLARAGRRAVVLR